jgi:type I restriction enzyme S subunit
MLVTLNSVCNIENGYAFKSKAYKDYGIPLIRISNFDNGEINFGDKSVFLEESYLKSKPDFIVNKGDIVIALSGATTGKYGIYNNDYPALLNQRIGIIRKSESKELNDKYFYHYLKIIQKEIFRKAAGAAQPNISTKEIGLFKISLPPIETQKEIAYLLDTADALRQKTQEQLDHLDELAQSIFLEMFGDPVLNDKGFRQIELGNTCEIISGFPFKSTDYKEEGVPICGGYIIDPDRLTWEEANYWDKSEYEKYKQYHLKKGDLVLAMDRPWIKGGFKIGLIKSTPDKSLLVQRTARVRCEDDQRYFIYYFLNSIAFKNHCLTTETTVPHIKLKDIRSFKVTTPPDSDLQKFHKSIQNIESHKEKLRLSSKESEDLFNCLLQDVFG